MKRISELNLKDAERRKTAEAKNSLEAYIYATKDKVCLVVDVFPVMLGHLMAMTL